MAPAALPHPVRNKKPPGGNKCMRQKGTAGRLNWISGGKKRTTSLIEAEKITPLLSVFTEKRKNEGLSLKSCAEYTKINGKFNRGFHGASANPCRTARERPGQPLPRDPTLNGRAQGPALAPPFGYPKRGARFTFSSRSGAPLFPDYWGLFEQSVKAPRPPRRGR